MADTPSSSIQEEIYNAASSGQEALTAFLTAHPGTTASSHSDDADETALHLAVAKGDLTAVESLIAAGADVNMRLGYGKYSPLYAAAGADTEAETARRVVSALLSARADPCLCDVDGSSAIDLAIHRRQDPDAVLFPLLRGASNPATVESCFNRTPLHSAAVTGASPRVIYALLSRGLDPLQKSYSGTALDEAGKQEHSQTLAALCAAAGEDALEASPRAKEYIAEMGTEAWGHALASARQEFSAFQQGEGIGQGVDVRFHDTQ